MKSRIQKILAGSGGSEIAEAALVLPLVFMVLLAIYWFGRAFNVYATINHAAREGARYAVAQSCASCGNSAPTVANIASQVGQAMQDSGLNPAMAGTGTATPPACGGAGVATCTTASGSGVPAIQYCTNVQLVNTITSPLTGAGAPACGISIDFTYPYQMPLPFTSLNQQQLTLTAHVQMRAEQ